MDKLVHLLVAWILFDLSVYFKINILASIISIVTLIFSKELIIDKLIRKTFFSWIDVVYSFIGLILSISIYLITNSFSQ